MIAHNSAADRAETMENWLYDATYDSEWNQSGKGYALSIKVEFKRMIAELNKAIASKDTDAKSSCFRKIIRELFTLDNPLIQPKPTESLQTAGHLNKTSIHLLNKFIPTPRLTSKITNIEKEIEKTIKAFQKIIDHQIKLDPEKPQLFLIKLSQSLTEALTRIGRRAGFPKIERTYELIIKEIIIIINYILLIVLPDTTINCSAQYSLNIPPLNQELHLSIEQNEVLKFLHRHLLNTCDLIQFFTVDNTHEAEIALFIIEVKRFNILHLIKLLGSNLKDFDLSSLNLNDPRQKLLQQIVCYCFCCQVCKAIISDGVHYLLLEFDPEKAEFSVSKAGDKEPGKKKRKRMGDDFCAQKEFTMPLRTYLYKSKSSVVRSNSGRIFLEGYGLSDDEVAPTVSLQKLLLFFTLKDTGFTSYFEEIDTRAQTIDEVDSALKEFNDKVLVENMTTRQEHNQKTWLKSLKILLRIYSETTDKSFDRFNHLKNIVMATSFKSQSSNLRNISNETEGDGFPENFFSRFDLKLLDFEESQSPFVLRLDIQICQDCFKTLLGTPENYVHTKCDCHEMQNGFKNLQIGPQFNGQVLKINSGHFFSSLQKNLDVLGDKILNEAVESEELMTNYTYVQGLLVSLMDRRRELEQEHESVVIKIYDPLVSTNAKFVELEPPEDDDISLNLLVSYIKELAIYRKLSMSESEPTITYRNIETNDYSEAKINTPPIFLSNCLIQINFYSSSTEVDGRSLKLFESISGLGIGMEFLPYSFNHDELTSLEKEEIWRKVMIQLKLLHSKKVYHCDLKLENILIDQNKDPFIIDFGVGTFKFKGSKRSSEDRYEKLDLQDMECAVRKSGVICSDGIDDFISELLELYRNIEVIN